MTRGSTVLTLVLMFVLFGTCIAPPEAPTVAAPEQERTDSLWGRLARLGDPQPPPAPEPKVTRMLRRLQREAAEGPPGGDDAVEGVDGPDDPNTGVPPAIVTAALRLPANQRGVLGRLRIPAIKLDVAYRNGVHEAVVNRGPGHWPGTPLPTMGGNSVLSGHRTTFTHPFKHLDRLDNGDKIRVTLGNGDAVVYRVTKTTIVAESQYVKFVLRQPRSPRARRLTLFACHPKGSRRQRIVVSAAAEPVARPSVHRDSSRLGKEVADRRFPSRNATTPHF